MKILCLHGENSSSRDFKSQIDPIITQLQETHPTVAFDFHDGPLVSHSAASEPCFHFWDETAVTSLQAAHEWLSRLLCAQGPYHGIIALSQSSAVVASHMAFQQWFMPDHAPSFQFAVFINGSIPLVALRHIGAPVPQAAFDVLQEALEQRRGGLGPSQAHASRARRALVDSDDCFGLDLNRIPRELRLRIPTAHMWGLQDPMLPAATQLAGLCDPYLRRVHTYPGNFSIRTNGEKEGDIPEENGDLNPLAQLVVWCMDRARWPGQSELS